jgi:hypothetical protein
MVLENNANSHTPITTSSGTFTSMTIIRKNQPKVYRSQIVVLFTVKRHLKALVRKTLRSMTTQSLLENLKWAIEGVQLSSCKTSLLNEAAHEKRTKTPTTVTVAMNLLNT